MDKAKIVKLLELIGEIVDAPGMVWREKREAIVAEADDNDLSNLSEFAGWFEDGWSDSRT